MKCRSRTYIDNCIQEAMLKCMQVPSITAVGPTVPDKMTLMEKLNHFKNVNSRILTRFSFNLTWWPSFWPQVTKIWTWTKIIKTNILSKIHDDDSKNVTSWVLTRFSFDLAKWPSFWPLVTQFQTHLEIIKTNILSKINGDYLKSYL